MTTTSSTSEQTEAEVAPEDPFRYGWRPVQRERGDGYTTTELVPLTLNDVLHPEEGDQVTHSEVHERWCIYLYNVLRARIAADEHATVLHDVRIKWDTPDLKPHGPDIMVIRGVRSLQNWSTFDVKQEGVRPTLIIEVTAPETRQVDLFDKLDHYDLAGVPMYILEELEAELRRLRLE